MWTGSRFRGRNSCSTRSSWEEALPRALRRTFMVGSGAFRYEPLERWEQLPKGWSFVEVAGVATDSRDRVYVFNRGEHPLMVFDRDGRFLTSWGEGLFKRAH